MVTRNESMFSFFILMFATSAHSLFEGMALGLQTNLKTAIHLFIGIILHECLVAFALGLNAIRIQQENVKLKNHLKFALIFSITVPLGNLIGILVGYTPGHVGKFVSAIFQGFAAGTFIHVTFFELIPEEFLSKDSHPHHHHQHSLNHQNRQSNAESSSKMKNKNRLTKSRSSLSSSSSVSLTKSSSKPEDTVENDRNELNNSIEFMGMNSPSLIEDNDAKDDPEKEERSHPDDLRLKKILLLLFGFLQMALISYLFAE
ncbi:hypothetical protein SSS_05577 [Sarcoptes scabiei]|nr:hypothetical protein SSS_05577 [Sarcoptes scabiei]